MNAPTNLQMILGADGKPAFVVLPYGEYLRHFGNADLIPNEVATLVLQEDMPIHRAWREHLGLTQAEVAERMGVTASAVAQYESTAKVRKATRVRLAAALGITPQQLDA